MTSNSSSTTCRRCICIVLFCICLSAALGTACRKQDYQRVEGERAVAEGNRLRVEPSVESRRRAIEKYHEALSSWRILGDSREAAQTLKLIGDLYQEFGEFRESPCYYDLALQYEREINDLPLEIQICNGLSYVHARLNEVNEAQKYYQRALDLSRQINDRRGEAQAFISQGEIYYALGDRSSALDYYLKALPLSQTLGDLSGQAQSLLFAGYVYSDLSEAQKAFDCYNRALRLWESGNDHRGRALTLIAIAHLQSKLGEKQAALTLYDRSLSLIRAVGDKYEEGSVFHGMGFIYESMGESGTALYYHDQARNIYKQLGLRRDEAGALVVAGEAHFSIGDSQHALACFNEVLAVSQELGNKNLESVALKNIGAVYDSLGEQSKALKSFEDALAIHQAAGTRGGEISTLNSIGNTYRKAGQKKKALDYFKKALSVSQVWCNLNGQAQTHAYIAQVESDSGNLAEARFQIEQSMSLAEWLRTKVAVQELRASYFASIQQRFDLYIDLLMRQHIRRPSANLHALALEQSERARARSLLEELTGARADFLRWGDPALIDRLQKLQGQINAKADYKSQQLNAGATETELIITSKELTSLIIERDQVEAQIRAKRPYDSTLTQPRPAGIEEIQDLLDDQTLLLEYELGNERSYLWAVTRSGLQSYELPNRAAIEKAAVEVYKLLTTPRLDGQTNQQLENSYWQKASLLSRMILGKVAPQLADKRLLIVADGVLQYIPFQALPDPQVVKSSDPQPLMDRHEIVNLPSASTLAALRRETAQRARAPKTIAIFADPVFQRDDLRLHGKSETQPAPLLTINNASPNLRSSDIIAVASQTRVGRDYRRLHWTQNEAEAVMAVTSPAERRVWKGFDANRANALSPELSQYRIVHFATHGDLDTENPELSAIVLSFYNPEGRQQEAYLRLYDIYNLKLPADLIVLSACETALGKEIKGEGLIGLTRGFMYAGAARVMSSLWKVEDQSTAELMKHFYQYLLIEKLTPAAALRQAQIAVRKQSKWRLPYHWAGFVLQGEWK